MKQILHLGLGRFHRGHQAMYYQKSPEWRVISSTMRSDDERDKLRRVGMRYPVLELSESNEKLVWVDCIKEALSMKSDLKRLEEVALDPNTKIITLTVTEKGYCLDKNGRLDRENEGIKHDLVTNKDFKTVIGFLAYILSHRKDPVAVISCDNLRGNGEKLKAALVDFMGVEVKDNVTFPNTMVDRIVPALMPDKLLEFESHHQLRNSELIATEFFSQWVIEDHFPFPKPDWDKFGVEFVKDVKPFEEMKLRLLNASHSYLAYAGINRGYQFVHEAVADESLRKHVLSMLNDEVVPTLAVPNGFNVVTYVESLLARFKNNKLPHQLRQIAMDGSQKMPQRIFSSLGEARKSAKSTKYLEEAVNEWLEFLWASRDQKIDDPKAEELMIDVGLGKEVWRKNLLKKFIG